MGFDNGGEAYILKVNAITQQLIGKYQLINSANPYAYLFIFLSNDYVYAGSQTKFNCYNRYTYSFVGYVVTDHHVVDMVFISSIQKFVYSSTDVSYLMVCNQFMN